ncbi:hypothetical protein FSP39_005713 [Pinctada imbricata]|uniref:Protein CNPPD1 n=1 Tax=Pinctada imbricata TaxID=66713 RepID=A0AA89BJ55_PINIB|nr:hypothetical protein FSP39_005713 [Pinctada imbricata]
MPKYPEVRTKSSETRSTYKGVRNQEYVQSRTYKGVLNKEYVQRGPKVCIIAVFIVSDDQRITEYLFSDIVSKMFTFYHIQSSAHRGEDHEELAERLRKTLYYGQHPKSDRPSLPLTEAAIEFFQEAAPRKLGRIDPDFAAATVRQACVSPSSVMMGMMYTKSLRHRNPEYLQQITSSDLFLISMMMASKYLYDEGTDDEIFNDEWAASADMETEEINEMERNFLSAIDWNLFIHRREFENVLHDIEKRIALQQGKKRGDFTYTDIWVLLHDPHLILISRQVAGEITKVFLVTSLAYIAGILTMVGSTLLVTGAATALSPLMLTASSVVQPLPEVPKAVLPGQILQDSLSSKRSWSVSAVISQLLTLVSIPSLFTVSRSPGQPKIDEVRRQNRSCSPNERDTNLECIAYDHNQATTKSEQLQPHCQLMGNAQTSESTATVNESPTSDTNLKQHSGLGLAYTVLLTIQDMLAHYAKRFGEGKESESGTNRHSERVCAEGPCLQSSNRYCWNVTMGIRKGTLNQCRECAKTATNGNQNCQTNKGTEQIKSGHQRLCGNIPTFNIGAGKCGDRSSCCGGREKGGQGQFGQESSRPVLYDENPSVRCCCQEPLSATVDRGGGFLDVSLGFHTQHSVFVTY